MLEFEARFSTVFSWL